VKHRYPKQTNEGGSIKADLKSLKTLLYLRDLGQLAADVELATSNPRTLPFVFTFALSTLQIPIRSADTSSDKNVKSQTQVITLRIPFTSSTEG
jgi:hypothetical protein